MKKHVDHNSVAVNQQRSIARSLTRSSSQLFRPGSVTSATTAANGNLFSMHLQRSIHTTGDLFAKSINSIKKKNTNNYNNNNSQNSNRSNNNNKSNLSAGNVAGHAHTKDKPVLNSGSPVPTRSPPPPSSPIPATIPIHVLKIIIAALVIAAAVTAIIILVIDEETTDSNYDGDSDDDTGDVVTLSVMSSASLLGAAASSIAHLTDFASTFAHQQQQQQQSFLTFDPKLQTVTDFLAQAYVGCFCRTHSAAPVLLFNIPLVSYFLAPYLPFPLSSSLPLRPPFVLTLCYFYLFSLSQSSLSDLLCSRP